MRSKEFANDYRYFLILTATSIISDDEMEEIRSTFPELPADKSKRYISEFQIEKMKLKLFPRQENYLIS
ncbi:MAG: hypothetical protein Ct9H90mP6_04700 [Gammaproteobacteria bacterium]|nr:MAG: hypothetical protein Ct9H90mP6_04700 [Gammaproteobacteria bacterium]